MALLSGRHDGRRILVPIAVLRSDNPADLTFVEGLALLDTGATSSAIGPRIVSELKLDAYMKDRLVVATEERMVDYYLFRLGLFTDRLNDAAPIMPYVFAEISGFGMRDSKDFDVILGMDVLKQCDFRLDRSGAWELHFGSRY